MHLYIIVLDTLPKEYYKLLVIATQLTSAVDRF